MAGAGKVADRMPGLPGGGAQVSVWATDRGRVRLTLDGPKQQGEAAREHVFMPPDVALAIARDLTNAAHAALGVR